MMDEYLSCDICKELFDGNTHIPRMLECGHSFCTYCLISVMGNRSSKCPVCQQVISYQFVTDAPVNYNFMQLAEKVNAQQDIAASLTDSTVITDEQDPFNGTCLKHNLKQKLYCETCDTFLCKECATADHKQCSTIAVVDLLEKRCFECYSEIENLKKDCFIEHRKLKKLNDEILNELEIYFNLAEEQEKDLQMTRGILQNLNRDLNEVSSLETKILESKFKFGTFKKLKVTKESCYTTLMSNVNRMELEVEGFKQLTGEIENCQKSTRKTLLCNNETVASNSRATDILGGQKLPPVPNCLSSASALEKKPSKRSSTISYPKQQFHQPLRPCSSVTAENVSSYSLIAKFDHLLNKKNRQKKKKYSKIAVVT